MLENIATTPAPSPRCKNSALIRERSYLGECTVLSAIESSDTTVSIDNLSSYPACSSRWDPLVMGRSVMRKSVSLALLALFLSTSAFADRTAPDRTPKNLTGVDSFWHQSTFNAENLNNNGSGNHALWSGLAPGDPRGDGYALLPGYGNNWFDIAMYESGPLADPSVGQVVDLDFFFNYDVWDTSWDFVRVQYDTAGTWSTVMEVTGVSRDENNVFQSPGVQFSTVQEAPIVYAGNDYGGPGGNQIRIRFVVTSDGGWSDQDIGAGIAGAAQVDDITLTTSQGTFTEDFEGPGPWLFNPFDPVATPVASPQLQRAELFVAPNPFNPSTIVSFTAPIGSRGSVRVFNLRGELVRTLHSGAFVSQEFRWDGTDTKGAPVSSGVYLIRATDGSMTQTTKVALVE